MILETKSQNRLLAYCFSFFILLILLVNSCQKSSINYIHLVGNAQGTTFSIIYEDSQQREFAPSVDSIFQSIDKSMSLWDSSSIISKINSNQTNVSTDEHFQKVFQRALFYAELTDGLFDLTVGPLVKRWGFYFKKNEAPPDSFEVSRLLECVGWTKVRLEDGVFIKDMPCTEIDLNAIAQGYTVDVLSEFLERKGIYNYFVELGGELRVLGVSEARTLWKIGIDKPVEEHNSTSEKRELQHIVSLGEGALATSGNYRKFILVDGKKFSHAINPHSGYPSQNNLLSVSVKAKKCMDADALATCFLMMGLDKSLDMARKMELDLYCIYESDEGILKEAQLGNWSQ